MSWLVYLVGAIVLFRVARRWVVKKKPKLKDEAPESGGHVNVDAHLKIEYLSAKGEKTERRIRVRRFYDVRELGLIKAYCYLRSGDRTFRIDRISSCIDTDTGEVVEDVRAHLRSKAGLREDSRVARDGSQRKPPALKKRPAKGEVSPAGMIIKRYPDLVRVLMFVAIEDGKVTRPKQQIIARYLSRVMQDDQINEGTVAMLAVQQGKPTLASFKQAVGRIANEGKLNPVLVAGCCRYVAEEDGVITEDEEAALEYLDRRVMALSES